MDKRLLDTEKIFSFIERKGISNNKIENVLGITTGSIRSSKRYIPKKYIKDVVEYLVSEYGYGVIDEVKSSDIGVIDNPDELGSRRWMDGWQFGASDDLMRFRDKGTGLWKTIEHFGMRNDKELGRVLRDEFVSDGEVFEDETGEYYRSVGGYDVYVSYKHKRPFRKVVEFSD